MTDMPFKEHTVSPIQRPRSTLGATLPARLVSLASAGAATLAVLLSVHALSLHEVSRAAVSVAAAQAATARAAI
jgi:hypothetical protein